jgi:hypothetical protein
MIVVSLVEVQNMFEKVIKNEISRDAAHHWARERMEADDYNAIEFSPPSDMMKIWSGLVYLIGFDLEEEPGVYLCSIENIQEKYFSIFGVPFKR